MRNLDERMGEIARRSEEILARRKKRRIRVLSLCVPAVLCACICAAVFLPNAQQRNAGAAPECIGAKQGDAITCVEAQISGANAYSRLVTDASEAGAICAVLESLLADAQQATTPQDEMQETAAWPDGSTQGGWEEIGFDYTGPVGKVYGGAEFIGYRIDIIESDGTQRTYLLDGVFLTDRTAGICVRLTDAQRGELYAALQLPNG